MAAARAEPHGDAGWGLGGGGGDAALQCWAGRVLRVWGRQRGWGGDEMGGVCCIYMPKPGRRVVVSCKKAVISCSQLGGALRIWRDKERLCPRGRWVWHSSQAVGTALRTGSAGTEGLGGAV